MKRLLFFRILLFSFLFLYLSGSLRFLFAAKKAESDGFYQTYQSDYQKISQQKFIHSPVRDKQCSRCHTSVKDKKKIVAKGNALCFTCHKELEKEIKTKKVHSLLKDGECSTCHEVHSSALGSLLNATGSECSTCHDLTDLKKTHFGILLKKGACTSCHEAHVSSKNKLLIETGHPMFFDGGCDACHTATGADGKSKLAASGEKLCYTCHSDIQDLTKKKVVHAVLSDCSICHTAHVAKTKKLLYKKMNDLCYDCHLADTFSQHPIPKHPVYLTGRINCISCHNPHASDNKKMLNDTGKDCTNCHEVKSKQLLTAHFDIVVSKDSCPKCHTFAKIASAHPNFTNHSCSACHAKKPKEGKVELLKPGKELCYLCHTKIKEVISTKKFVHGIVKDGECSTCHEVHSSFYKSLLNDTGNNCTTCHDPKDMKNSHFGILAKKDSCLKCHEAHAGDKEKLLLAKGHPFIYDKSCDPCHEKSTEKGEYRLTGKDEKLCFMCHSDIEDLLKKKVVHRVAKDCTICHLAHISNFAKLLTKSSEKLCADCHLNIASHPISQHPISGTTDPRFSKEKKPLTCLSCHNPHGADYSGLLFADYSTGQLCLSCHKK